MVNPLQAVGIFQMQKWFGNQQLQVSGSIYATAHFDNFNPRFFAQNATRQECITELTNFTAVAAQQNLAPIFDLVLNHVARDQLVYNYIVNYLAEQITVTQNQGQSTLSYNVQQHDGSMLGSQIPLGMMQHQNSADFIRGLPLFVNDPHFHDVSKINYEDNVVQRLFIDLVWKPFIYRYIVEYGFTGVRLDAVKHIPGAVLHDINQYISEVCQHVHHVLPIILGELVGQYNTQELRNNGITHIYNSLFFYGFFSHWQEGNSYRGGNVQSLAALRHLVNPPGPGGTFGYIGNHDFGTAYGKLSKLTGKQVVPELSLKERLWAISLTSDAGYYVLCGDEFGASREVSVFPQRPDPFPYRGEGNSRWGGTSDFVPIIKQINTILAQLLTAPVNIFVFHDYIEVGDRNIDLIVRQPQEGHNLQAWQGVIIFIMDIPGTSSLEPGNAQQAQNMVRIHLNKDLPNDQTTWYFIKGGKAYLLQNNQFELVRPDLFQNLNPSASN